MKTDIYQTITNNIIDALERVRLDDYQAPFARLTSQQLPINPITAKAYNGINTLILWLQQHEHGYSSNEWGTFRQWKEQGAQVKKGEKSTMIIFYKRLEKKDSTGDQNESNTFHMIKSYCVFNADQVDGYTASTGLESGNVGTVDTIEHIESFIDKSGAVIEQGTSGACYMPLADKIEMPCKKLFFNNVQSATELARFLSDAEPERSKGTLQFNTMGEIEALVRKSMK